MAHDEGTMADYYAQPEPDEEEMREGDAEYDLANRVIDLKLVIKEDVVPVLRRIAVAIEELNKRTYDPSS